MYNLLFDLLFPQERCCICHQHGRFGSRHPWCPQCEQYMLNLQRCCSFCDKCGKYLQEGQGLCRDCQSNSPQFEIVRAVGPYEEPYRIAIKVLKFMGRKYLAPRMGKMMAHVVKNEPRYWPLDLMVPVPISKGNLQQRGFNQTELLGRYISKSLQIKMDSDVIRRVKETPSQRELSKEEREKNLLYAFQIKDYAKVRRKNILLVDDVYTTGSTIRECTRVLKEAGASRVSVITWATGKGF